MDLILGSALGAFSSHEDRRKAWQAHRHELMDTVNPCSRPEAYWDYDRPGAKLPGEWDWSALQRLGLLRPDEAAYLARTPARPRFKPFRALAQRAMPHEETPADPEAA